jgi:hypothetical protein
MRTEIVEVGATYLGEFLMRRGRTPRYALFRDSAFGEVRVIDRAEASTAFRIEKPTMDCSWSARRDPGRKAHFVIPASAREVLLFDGNLWWPMIDRAPDGSATMVSVEQCRSRIANNSEFVESAKLWFGRDCMHVVDGPNILYREMLRNNREQKLLEAQQCIHQNVLFCGEWAYVRGGPPLFVSMPGYRKGTWIIDVVRSAPDRRGDYSRDDFQSSPIYTDYKLDVPLGAGRFWLADEARLAIAAAHHLQTAFPAVTVHDPDFIDHSRSRIRLDAMFRAALKAMYEFDRHLDDVLDLPFSAAAIRLNDAQPNVPRVASCRSLVRLRLCVARRGSCRLQYRPLHASA